MAINVRVNQNSVGLAVNVVNPEDFATSGTSGVANVNTIADLENIVDPVLGQVVGVLETETLWAFDGSAWSDTGRSFLGTVNGGVTSAIFRVAPTTTQGGLEVFKFTTPNTWEDLPLVVEAVSLNNSRQLSEIGLPDSNGHLHLSNGFGAKIHHMSLEAIIAPIETKKPNTSIRMVLYRPGTTDDIHGDKETWTDGTIDIAQENLNGGTGNRTTSMIGPSVLGKVKNLITNEEIDRSGYKLVLQGKTDNVLDESLEVKFTRFELDAHDNLDETEAINYYANTKNEIPTLLDSTNKEIARIPASELVAGYKYRIFANAYATRVGGGANTRSTINIRVAQGATTILQGNVVMFNDTSLFLGIPQIAQRYEFNETEDLVIYANHTNSVGTITIDNCSITIE